MPRSGPRTVRRYSADFKLTAVRLSQQPGLQVKTVAAALAIHPFMLSKWRKDARDGRLRGESSTKQTQRRRRELAELQRLEHEYALLKEEHALLKKAIRFCSARKATSLPSSSASTPRSASARSAAATASRRRASTRGVGAE